MTVAIATTSKALDLYLATEQVVGQAKARKQLAAALERQWQVHLGKYPKAHAVLLGGRSGSGKTFLSSLMCRHLGLAYAEVDATRYTESGYKGLDLQHMFIPLIEAAARIKDEGVHARVEAFGRSGPKPPSVLKRGDIDDLIEMAETGVILLDEFDKWLLRTNHVTGEKDKTIQSELLKMIEGTVLYVSDTDEEVGVLFDTTRVLIICAGAFAGLFQIIARRLHMDSEDRSYLNQEQFWNQIIPEDFEKFGLLPELTGRLSRHIFTRPLTIAHLRTILSQPDGVLAEYRSRYEEYGCQWSVSEGAVISIAQRAIERDTGARAIEHIVDKLLGGEPLYEAAVAEYPCQVVLTPEMTRAEVRPL